jgi:hypothetical protein
MQNPLIKIVHLLILTSCEQAGHHADDETMFKSVVCNVYFKKFPIVIKFSRIW